MDNQGMGGYSKGWLHNRGESAINGWEVFRRDEISGKGWVVDRFSSLGEEGWMPVRWLDGISWRMFSSEGFQQPGAATVADKPRR